MTQYIFLNEILEEYQKIVSDNKANFDPEIKLVAKGGLDLLPATLDLSSKIPAWFIQPLSFNADFNPMQSYEIEYPFRFVYVRKFEADEQIQEKVILETNKLIDLLLDNAYLTLPNLTITNGQVLYQRLTAYDTTPMEAALPIKTSTDLMLCAFEIFARVRISRS